MARPVVPTGSDITHFNRVTTDEGELRPSHFTVSLPINVPASAGDGLIHYRLNRDAQFLGAFFSMSDTGGTSGSTTLMVHNATAAVDLLLGPLSVAYDAANPYAEDEAPAAAHQNLSENDLLRVDVDAVPGSGNAKGILILHFQ